MSARLALVAGLAFAFLFAGPTRADQIADGIAAIPGAVDEVRIGGTWADDDKSGVYRIVIARSGGDEVTARLFIQWVAYDDDGQATVEHSLEIKEFAALNVDIDDFTSESDEDGLSVFIRTIDPGDNNDQSYQLFVFSPTNYRFGLATN